MLKFSQFSFYINDGYFAFCHELFCGNYIILMKGDLQLSYIEGCGFSFILMLTYTCITNCITYFPPLPIKHHILNYKEYEFE